jgi:hypothetical protein
MISRALIQSFTPDIPRNPLYAGQYNLLFACLAEHHGPFSPSFIDLYKLKSLDQQSGARHSLMRFLRHYLRRTLKGGGDYLVIDNGVHGTMPLMALTISPKAVDLSMYTAVPWLQDFYGTSVYSADSQHMRFLETVVCQEELFRFFRIDGDRIIIEASQDIATIRLARLEIAYFLNAVDRRFLRP